jgi:hypothetical protein
MIVQPMFIEQPIRWSNVESLVPLTLESVQPGTFLEDETGKRYPSLRSIAMRLLDGGRKITHKRQGTNFYAMSVGVDFPTPVRADQEITLFKTDDPKTKSAIPAQDSCSHTELETGRNGQAVSSVSQEIKTKTVDFPTPSNSDTSDEASFWVCSDCLKTHISIHRPDTCKRCGGTDWERVPAFIWKRQERLKIWWQGRWREKHPSAPRRATPLVTARRCRFSDTNNKQASAYQRKLDSESETVARHAHEQVRDLSMGSARSLVKLYGLAQVEKAVQQVCHRSGIMNPAGFLVSLLKSENLFYSEKIKNRTQKSRAEDTTTWITQMANSPFLDFLANADDFKRDA